MLESNSHGVWVIEDSDEDFDVFQHAAAKAGFADQVRRFASFKEINESSISGPFEDGLPKLVVMDLNLPDISGPDLLHFLRFSSKGQALPIVVFTSSKNANDISSSYASGASSYIVKPMGLRQYVKVLQALRDYWIDNNKV